ncbi:ABC transporter ATP-binding protein [Pelagovum pacificum]|uniref:sn-glycerol-3-phosphate ABC transporter ATP-binding protein UgpC n=1 Tax=Pelagovum pacificum TaxID=2588711 RepID=A0A5C5GAI1_9RHOB|nr:sn-glycerol-3-phosphate ABC transporter ATP-binding protein UgpC [Pelagovum pacificum]QQA41454.1 sn-glycerol-3-phosphate ABC transporter ATP-binding protein UgpC [Pelagovum pacificum]TNY31743.1 sn-glycerol-3-phosphate ABC transporter ATP-binding protein UgpC [Pelagovum pacificum]
MARLDIEHVTKNYGAVEVIPDLTLSVRDQEFVALVGPSGCGKSTTLRMIAGLEKISRGEMLIDGQVINDLEPDERGIAMVFQSYALYPHMTVAKNMSFSLRVARHPREEINRRVKDAAEILGLTAYLDRKPSALSGGQRQRVAMGRAIVRQPKIFLFDEPLSNLDAKLRTQMRTEIKRIHRSVGATTVYVTHDQVEAMTLADRIVIMNAGKIEQVGTPSEVYKSPASTFVASFIGTPPMNLIPAVVANGVLRLEDGTEIPLPVHLETPVADGQKLIFGIRPDQISPEGHGMEASDPWRKDADINLAEPLGSETLIFFGMMGQEWVGKMYRPRDIQPGERLTLLFDLANAHVFDAETGTRIT